MCDDTVTGREPVPGHPNLVRIIFENRAPLTIFLGDWLDYDLKLHMQVTQQVLEKCIQRHLTVEGFLKVENYIRLKPRTEMEVRQFLKRKGVEVDIVAYVIELLKVSRLIDDSRYGDLFVQSKMTSTSRRALMFKLKARGISGETARQSTAQVTDELQAETASKLAIKYLRQKSALDPKQARLKCAQYLQRKGFDQSVVIVALKKSLISLTDDLDFTSM